jgi:hypothetical protein
MPGFPTPEDAAMFGFPAAYCKILAVDVDGDDGFVVLDAGPGGYRYLYSGTVKRTPDGWQGGSDSNGGGMRWSATHAEAEIGVVAVCDEAPPDADAARVEWRGEVRETPIRNGVYLVTWFREPFPESPWPRVTGFHMREGWRSVTRDDFDWIGYPPSEYGEEWLSKLSKQGPSDPR